MVWTLCCGRRWTPLGIGCATQLSDWWKATPELRRLLIVAEFLLAILRGCIKDEVATKGFDQLDDENFSDWLIRHGASVMVASSPMALNTVNLSYQYPKGDTGTPPP